MGDIRAIDLGILPGLDIITSGPPCPPWAGNGVRKGSDDARAKVFEQVLRWIVHMGTLDDNQKLKIVIIENVGGCMKNCNGQRPFMLIAKEELAKHMPHFVFDIITLQLSDYSIPHIRERVLLRGLNKSIANYIAPPLKPFGKGDLRNFLRRDLPASDRNELNQNKLQNLRDHEFKVKCMLKSKTLQDGDIAVFSIDRADEKAWKQRICVGAVPTLTCHNTWLWVCSTADMSMPPEQREFSRFLDPRERLALHGLSPSLASTLRPTELLVKACGNSYAPQIIAAAVVPMLGQMAASGVKAGEEIMGSPPSASTNSFSLEEALKKTKTEKRKATKGKAPMKGKAKKSKATKSKAPMKGKAKSKAKGKAKKQ